MGLLDKLKDAANLVTGGAARVTIEFPSSVLPGEDIQVRVVVTSAGSAVKSDGVFVDLRAQELIDVPRGMNSDHGVRTSHTYLENQIRIASAFTLGANETRVFEADVRLPNNAQPSYSGHYCRHEWSLRGRLEALGNDPDSGFRVLHVGG